MDLNGNIMNRTILFKAKRVDNGEWVCGDLYQEKHPFKNELKQVMIVEYRPDLCLVSGANDSNHYWREVHPETVCQFTGLLDKNGNKIFEGDKIIFGDERIVQVVEWRNGQVMARQIRTVGSYIGLGYCKWEEHAEITGNIHDK